MAKKLNRDTLGVRRFYAKNALKAQKRQILICAGTGCIAGGSLKIYDHLKEECARRGLDIQLSLMHEDGKTPSYNNENSVALKKSGCHGFCEMGPLLQIEPEGILYTHVKLEDCDDIIEKTILGGELIPHLLYQLDGVSYAKHDEIPFYHQQTRVVLGNCGTTDAEDLDEYLARDGYSAMEKALFEMTDEAICKEIMDSGLRGRGGGGFPQAASGTACANSPKARSMWSATATRATPAPLWTAPSWKAIPTPSSKACSLPPLPPAVTKATSMCVRSIRWPFPV